MPQYSTARAGLRGLLRLALRLGSVFERFRIKTALRAEMIELRKTHGLPLRSRAEMLFFEPAFEVAPVMRQRRATAQQAMVFMVSDYVLQAAEQGVLAHFAASDPELCAELKVIYDHIVSKARADSSLMPYLAAPQAGAPAPFSDTPNPSHPDS